LRREARHMAPHPVRVLDLATGAGDVPIRLARWASREKLTLECSGCDISPTALDIAGRRAAENSVRIALFQHDVVKDGIPVGYDVVIASLFLHHLSEFEAVGLLRRMSVTANRMLLVNDLRRTRINLGLVTLATRCLSRSRIVQHDGPASVRAAFTIDEARQLAVHAGLTNAIVTARFPCRWLLVWRKPA
jgi:2-polyprenyl-3-methyl-5-hydroxy-6-metoxy-1,4-benzoquinol methylase